jgi:hypothetical protein
MAERAARKMKHKAYILTTDGEIKVTAPKNGTDFSLDELKAAIGGGYIEIVRIPHNRLMVVDEEGKIKDPPLPLNMRATLLYCGGNEPDFNNPYHTINGDALVCHESQIT